MKTQRKELFEQISANGWSIKVTEQWRFLDWADEIWLLESTWSPVGCRAFLVFLVDPMIEDWQHRKKGESVWAVGVSTMEPEYGMSDDNSFLLALNKRWREEMPTLIKHLSSFRQSK